MHFTLAVTVWIANTEIGLDSNNSVIKRLWCSSLRRNQIPLVPIKTDFSRLMVPLYQFTLKSGRTCFIQHQVSISKSVFPLSNFRLRITCDFEYTTLLSKTLRIGTFKFGQTSETQIKLTEQSDQGLYLLPFHLYLLDT